MTSSVLALFMTVVTGTGHPNPVMQPIHPALQPYGAIPSKRQLAWHEMDYYAFVHFGPNTFTNLEWGHGSEDPKIFNPTALDCRQWAQTFKDAGMKGVILTAKHHDGFCLFPSKFSSHTVMQSPLKRDVVKELSEACKQVGIKFGIYLSPWDRNHPTYGTPEYNDVFANTLTEVMTGYGSLFEVWFDGANGEGPNGKKQVYDFPKFHAVVRKYQPNAVMFSDAGPDIRWVGNENGIAPETCWATLNRDRYVPGTPLYKELGEGQPNGTHWVPAECDVSIRPGWFYHAEEDGKVKTPEQLEDLYFRSVGRGSSFLLNVPPDRRGLIADPDIKSLMGFRRRLDQIFAQDLTKGGKATGTSVDGRHSAAKVLDGNPKSFWAATENTGVIEILLPKAQSFNVVDLREHIALGQRISSFQIEAQSDGAWKTIAMGTTVGNRRLATTDLITTDRIRLKFTGMAPPLVSSVQLFKR